MSDREKLLQIARGELGLGNGTKYGAAAGVAWCAYFIRWCASQAGIRQVTIPKKPWCDDLREYYIKDRLYFPREGYTPKVGDIICFHWGDSEDPYAHVQHVGLVSGIDGSYVYTIEGNAGVEGRVCAFRYKRNARSILGYCSPLYETEASGKEPEGYTHTQVSVCEEKPILTRRPSDGKLVPTTPQSGILSIAIGSFSARALAGAKLSQTRDRASVLTFEVIPTEDFFEGDRVIARVGEVVVFSGFVFQKSRDRDGIIRVTAYDSLRYFKNRDTYIYENKTASDLFRAVCRDHSLPNYRAEESGVLLPYRVEDNATLFDILAYAVSETEKKSGVRFVLRDEGGCVTLRRVAFCGVVLDESNITDFSYTSGIDGSINRVKTISEEDGVRKIQLVQDTEGVRRYGLLQTVGKNWDLERAREELRAKSGVRRNLKLTVPGDTRIVAGDLVVVRGVWGDVVLDHEFFIHAATHTWDGYDHVTTLTLEGGEFDA